MAQEQLADCAGSSAESRSMINSKLRTINQQLVEQKDISPSQNFALDQQEKVSASLDGKAMQTIWRVEIAMMQTGRPHFFLKLARTIRREKLFRQSIGRSFSLHWRRPLQSYPRCMALLPPGVHAVAALYGLPYKPHGG